MVSKAQATGLLNVPNQITAVRLVLALVVFGLIPWGQYQWAMWIFILAASTDWVDGYWARRFNQVTQLGRIFDPFVDKIIICGVFILLAEAMGPIQHGVRGWMAVLVVGRELLVTALRGYIEQHGGDFSASWAGKWKMVFQCAAAVAGLLALDWAPAVLQWLTWTLAGLVWLAVISTVYSGAGYVLAAARILRAGR